MVNVPLAVKTYDSTCGVYHISGTVNNKPWYKSALIQFTTKVKTES